jgi:hypothetical protein
VVKGSPTWDRSSRSMLSYLFFLEEEMAWGMALFLDNRSWSG